MATLIKNGTIVTAESEFIADIYLDGEEIAAIGANIEPKDGDEVIDADGKYILPGGVDQHVHFSFSYKGSKTRGFEYSNAAAIGGTAPARDGIRRRRAFALRLQRRSVFFPLRSADRGFQRQSGRAQRGRTVRNALKTDKNAIFLRQKCDFSAKKAG